MVERCKPKAAIVVGDNDAASGVRALNRLGIFRIVLLSWDGSLVLQEAMFSGVTHSNGAVSGQGEQQAEAEAEDELYIINTSGSTGSPKSIVGSRTGLENRMKWYCRQFPFQKASFVDPNAGEICLKRAPSAFIDSITETLTPLLQGIPLFISRETEHIYDIIKLAHLCEQHDVSRISVLPSQLQLLIKFGPKPWRSLRFVFISGEKVDSNLVMMFQDWRKQGDGSSCRLISLYGSSEVTGDVSWIELSDCSVEDMYDRVAALASVPCYPVGQAIDNTELRIEPRLGTNANVGEDNDNWKPVPSTAELHFGEIIVSGVSVMCSMSLFDLLLLLLIYFCAGSMTKGITGMTVQTIPMISASGKKTYPTGDLGFIDTKTGTGYIW